MQSKVKTDLKILKKEVPVWAALETDAVAEATVVCGF